MPTIPGFPLTMARFTKVIKFLEHSFDNKPETRNLRIGVISQERRLKPRRTMIANAAVSVSGVTGCEEN